MYRTAESAHANGLWQGYRAKQDGVAPTLRAIEQWTRDYTGTGGMRRTEEKDESSVERNIENILI